MLIEDAEQHLINHLLQFPEIVKKSGTILEPQLIINYLQDFAGKFHKYYANYKVITENKLLTEARLLLIKAIQIGMRNGLTIIGISAPKKM